MIRTIRSGAIDTGMGKGVSMRFDLPRSILAALAALLAGVAAYSAYSDQGIASYDFAIRFFTLEAIVGLAFALWPSGGIWSLRRRCAAAVVAAISTGAAPFLLVLTSARSACGCGNPANDYRIAPVLGALPHDWVIVATVLFPILMAATTAAFLDRLAPSRKLA
jgi:hypothetical protein